MSSPVLWGPNNLAINLENGAIQADGSYNKNDGAKNYIGNATFENNTTNGWSLGNISAITNGLPTGTPTFGSGAAGSLAIISYSANPISGVYSLSYSDSNITTVGNMVATNAITLDAEDQARVLTFSFSYKAQTGASNCNFSGTSFNSFAVAVYDVTNSAFLGVAGAFNLVQSSGVGVATGTFQTLSTTGSIRFMIYNANATSATSTTMVFDSFYLGPQKSALGPAVTDWVAYTPTFSASWGTVTSTNFTSRRIGDSLEVQGTFTSTTPTAAVATISLGYNGGNGNVSIDSNKMSNTNVCGEVAQTGTASTTFFGIAPIIDTTTPTLMKFGVQTSTTSIRSGYANASAIVASGQSVGVHWITPIVGWSSNTAMSADTDTRVIATRATSPSTALTSSPATVIFPTVTYDLSGSYNSTTGIFTVPVSGKYKVSCFLQTASVVQTSGSAFATFLYKNGSQYSQIAVDINKGTASSVSTAWVCNGASDEVSCVAGDTLNIAATSTASVSLNSTYGYVTFERLSGPAVVTATESVNARYIGATASVTSSFSAISYTTKDYDSHNAYSGSVYTIPVSGKYTMTARVLVTDVSGTHQTGLQIYKNSVAINSIYTPGGPSGVPAGVSSDLILVDQLSCSAGDTIVFRVTDSGTTPSIVADSTRTLFSIARVGN